MERVLTVTELNRALTLVAWWSVLAFAATGLAVSSDGSTPEVTAFEAEWARSMETNDPTRLEKNLTADFQRVASDGAIQDRSAYVKELRNGSLQIDQWIIEKTQSRVINRVAIVTTVVGIVGRKDRVDVSGYYQITDTLIQEDGGWRGLLRQETRISARKDPLFERIWKPNGRPSVAIFVQGSFCPHCMAQLTNFARDLAGRDLNVTVVSADSEEDLKAFPDLPFALLADPQHLLFRRFGVLKEVPLHGTVLIDREGRVVFQTVNKQPFTQVDVVLMWLDKATVAATVRAAQIDAN